MFVDVENIVETPFFVDSCLTGLIQMADLCAFACRRFFDNNEEDLFNRLFPRINREGEKIVGLRHYVKDKYCTCRICMGH